MPHLRYFRRRLRRSGLKLTLATGVYLRRISLFYRKYGQNLYRLAGFACFALLLLYLVVGATRDNAKCVGSFAKTRPWSRKALQFRALAYPARRCAKVHTSCSRK